MSFRRLGVLVRQLPPSSRVGQRQLGHGYWTTGDYLLANVVDLLAGANWQRGGGKGSRPKPVKRPHRDVRVGQPIPIEEARKRRARTLGRAS